MFSERSRLREIEKKEGLITVRMSKVLKQKTQLLRQILDPAYKVMVNLITQDGKANFKFHSTICTDYQQNNAITKLCA